jgi:transcription initiation factor IIE alpha subunit
LYKPGNYVAGLLVFTYTLFFTLKTTNMKTFHLLLMAVFTIVSVNIFAQEKAGKKDKGPHPTLYTCPMHDSVAAKKPGNCPVCGMKLELSKKEQMKKDVTKSYSCPMHTDVTSDKPGKCPKCGMDLNKSKKEQMKMEVMKTYSCPMHPEVTSEKPGKCSKCGMDLVKSKGKTKTEVAKTYVCPMHADVTSNKPGKCSKCGMDLKEKKDNHNH